MMMTVVQMPEMLLLMLLLLVKAVRPVSLFRSMLAASSGTGAIGRGTVGTIRATVLMLLRMLVLLLQVQKMLLLMVWMWQATSSGHAELLLLLLLLVTAAGQILLTIDASGHQNDGSVGTLLQTPVLLGVRVTLTVTQILKHVTVQRGELVPYSLAFGLDDLAVAQQPLLALLHVLDLVGQRHNLVQLAFATVLSGDLVLAPPPDVPDQR